ncbi:MAG: hypothetical protein E6442_09025, partial [Veillonella sp.]|uniref:hypothetical protein n=1 Tax=Veillonella sp. TaxID=1926307 RepID=UPI00291034F3
PKSFSEAPSPSTISFYVNSVYNSSEIDKIRYCLPNRGTGGPTACAEPEVVFRGPITFNYLVLVLIRYIIVVKLIKSVIANPTDRKEGLRPLSPPYNEKIISIYDDRIVKRTGSENDFGLCVAQYSLIRITKK